MLLKFNIKSADIIHLGPYGLLLLVRNEPISFCGLLPIKIVLFDAIAIQCAHKITLNDRNMLKHFIYFQLLLKTFNQVLDCILSD
jgi:hypothetical protein